MELSNILNSTTQLCLASLVDENVDISAQNLITDDKVEASRH